MTYSTTAAEAGKSVTYGQAIDPAPWPYQAGGFSTLWVPGQSRLLLTFLPEDVEVFAVRGPSVTPGLAECPIHLPAITPADDERGWLRLAEGAFRFWDNPDDDAWDRV